MTWFVVILIRDSGPIANQTFFRFYVASDYDQSVAIYAHPRGTLCLTSWSNVTFEFVCYIWNILLLPFQTKKMALNAFIWLQKCQQTVGMDGVLTKRTFIYVPSEEIISEHPHYTENRATNKKKPPNQKRTLYWSVAYRVFVNIVLKMTLIYVSTNHTFRESLRKC